MFHDCLCFSVLSVLRSLPAGKGLPSWLCCVVFSCVLSLSHMVWHMTDICPLLLFVSLRPITIFQLYRDGSSWVEPVLS